VFYEAPFPSRFGKLYGKAETDAPAFVIPLLLSITIGRLKYGTAWARSRFEVDRLCGPAPNVLHAHCEARWDRLRGFVQTPEMGAGAVWRIPKSLRYPCDDMPLPEKRGMPFRAPRCSEWGSIQFTSAPRIDRSTSIRSATRFCRLEASYILRERTTHSTTSATRS
jgi:hypothetical protein